MHRSSSVGSSLVGVAVLTNRSRNFLRNAWPLKNDNVNKKDVLASSSKRDLTMGNRGRMIGSWLATVGLAVQGLAAPLICCATKSTSKGCCESPKPNLSQAQPGPKSSSCYEKVELKAKSKSDCCARPEPTPKPTASCCTPENTKSKPKPSHCETTARPLAQTKPQGSCGEKGHHSCKCVTSAKGFAKPDAITASVPVFEVDWAILKGNIVQICSTEPLHGSRIPDCSRNGTRAGPWLTASPRAPPIHV